MHAATLALLAFASLFTAVRVVRVGGYRDDDENAVRAGETLDVNNAILNAEPAQLSRISCLLIVSPAATQCSATSKQRQFLRRGSLPHWAPRALGVHFGAFPDFGHSSA